MVSGNWLFCLCAWTEIGTDVHTLIDTLGQSRALLDESSYIAPLIHSIVGIIYPFTIYTTYKACLIVSACCSVDAISLEMKRFKSNHNFNFHAQTGGDNNINLKRNRGNWTI